MGGVLHILNWDRANMFVCALLQLSNFVSVEPWMNLWLSGFMRSGLWGPEVRTNNDFDKSQENGCPSQEKVGFFIFFATWKSILVKNGLTFKTVILFNLSSK